jgi:hypothetical protein
VRRIGLVLLALALTATVRLAIPEVSVACSCAMPQSPMRAAAGDASVSVFTGVAGPQQAAGVPVTLTRWFQGPPPPSGVAVLDPAGFIDPMGGSCGTNVPWVGTEWIFATGRNAVGRYVVNLCTTHASLDSDAGRALLAEAVAVFGAPMVPEVPSSEPEPEPDPSAEPEPGAVTDPASLPGSIVPIVLIVLAVAGAAVGVFAVAGRRRTEG